MSNAADKDGESSHEEAVARVAAELESAAASLTTQLRDYFAKLNILGSRNAENDKPNDDPYHTLDI